MSDAEPSGTGPSRPAGSDPPDRPGWKLVGGHAALDLVNTESWRGGPWSIDRLADYGALLSWARAAGLIGAPHAAGLERLARRAPEKAAAVLAEVRELRAALGRLLEVHATGGRPPLAALERLNAVLARRPRQIALELAEPAGFAWRDSSTGPALEDVLWPIAAAAADLLTDPRLDRVKTCAGEECGWMFIDASRTGRRRWCSMEDCGNRAKATRHYSRRRRAAPPPAHHD